MRLVLPVCVLASGLPGCAPSGDTAGDDTGATVEDTGHPPIGGTPTLTVDDVITKVTNVFDVGLPAAWPIHEVYLDLMASGDATCPGDPDQLTGDVPVEGCTATSGFFYMGVSTYTETTDDTGDSYFNIDGDFEIILPTEERLEAGGFVNYDRRGTRDQWEASSVVSGTWSLDGADGALGAGISASLVVQGSSRSNAQDVFLIGPTAAADDAVYFDNVHLDVTDCDGRPTGAISVRDDVGYWTTLTYADDCSGCGEVTFFDGTDLGPACLPLDGIGAELVQTLGHWE